MNLTIDQIGGACPTQGYGTLDGELLYFRYRHDDAQLQVGPAEEPESEWGPMPQTRLYAEIRDVTGQDDRGWMGEDEARALIERMIPMLRPVAEVEEPTYAERLTAEVEYLTARMTPPATT